MKTRSQKKRVAYIREDDVLVAQNVSKHALAIIGAAKHMHTSSRQNVLVAIYALSPALWTALTCYP